MKWIKKLFSPKITTSGVVFLDTDILSAADIARIKQNLTPVFIEFSGHKAEICGCDVSKAVIKS